MKHALHRVKSFEHVGPYALRVHFGDGSVRIIDFAAVLEGEIFGPLRDLTLFRQVRIDPEVHTLVWPTGADFDPATLHDWPEHEASFKAAAREWAKQASAGVQPSSGKLQSSV